MMGLVQISKEEWDTDEMKTGRRVLFFSAPWCVQCKMSTPIVENIANESEIPFFKVDCKTNQDIADAYGVMSLPTTILLEDGLEKGRIAGGFSADELVDFVS